jgi:hypothetical protein
MFIRCIARIAGSDAAAAVAGVVSAAMANSHEMQLAGFLDDYDRQR